MGTRLVIFYACQRCTYTALPYCRYNEMLCSKTICKPSISTFFLSDQAINLPVTPCLVIRVKIFLFFPNCIILNHMSASVCSFNIWRTSTSNNINYRSFTLLHRIYLHIHWVFLICLVRFIPTLWLIQNLTKITVKTHTFFNTSIYIYSGKMLHSGWKAQCQQSHPDVAKFF